MSLCLVNKTNTTQVTMTRKQALSVLFVVLAGFTNWACPVQPISTHNLPFPEEIEEAINSKRGENLIGQATIAFHLDDSRHVVIENVTASTEELINQVWYTVHGMKTEDTTLVIGTSYNLKLTVH